MNLADQSGIFNVFHDGCFLFLRRHEQDIVFQVEIQYLAEIINPAYTHFQGTLINCCQCTFNLWNKEKVLHEDLNEISSLLITTEISNARFEGDQVYVHCLGDQNYSGGTLSFSCDAIRIFDEGGTEVLLDELLAVAQRCLDLYHQKT